MFRVTCDSEREDLALRGEVVMEHVDVINTAVISLVQGVVCCRKPEGGREIGSCLGMVLSFVASGEVGSCV